MQTANVVEVQMAEEDIDGQVFVSQSAQFMDPVSRIEYDDEPGMLDGDADRTARVSVVPAVCAEKMNADQKPLPCALEHQLLDHIPDHLRGHSGIDPDPERVIHNHVGVGEVAGNPEASAGASHFIEAWVLYEISGKERAGLDTA